MTNLISSFSPGADQNSFTGYLGMQFGLPIGYSIHVNSLGIRCATGDTGPHNVYLLNGTTTVASAVVDLTGGTVGTFYYTAITPVTLTGAGPFNILTQVTSGGQNCSLPGPTTLTSGAACITSYTTSLSTAVTTVVAAQQYVGLDLTYVATFDNATSNLVQGSTTSSWSADPTIVFGFAPTPGNLIVAMDAGDGNNPNTAAWTQFGYAGSGAGNMRYVYRYVQPGDTTVLPPFQIPATTAYAQAAAWEISGTGSTWVSTLDQYQNTQGSGSSFSTSTLTTATPNELGLVFVVADELGPSGPPTIASPWISNGGLIGHIYSGSFGQLAFPSAAASVSATGNFPAGFNDEQIGIVLLSFSSDTLTINSTTLPATANLVVYVSPPVIGSIVATTRPPEPTFTMLTENVLTTINAPTVTVPSYTSLDFRDAFLRLLPTGRAWQKYPTSILAQSVGLLIGCYARSDIEGLPPSTVGMIPSQLGNANRAGQLLLDGMPSWNASGGGAIVELLPEWQATLNLPDPCQNEITSIDQQVRQCVARFVGVGGQSIPFYEAFCATLGFVIQIQEFAPFRTDISTADSPLADDAAAYLWQVNSIDSGSWEFETDINCGDELLGGFSNTVLQCEIERLRPAHTLVTFAVG